MKLDLNSIEKLAKSVEENNLTEITVEVNGIKVTMKKEELKQELVMPAPNYVETRLPQGYQVEQSNDLELTNEKVIIEGEEIKSPMVGTYYSAASPESNDFVKVGDKVNIGDVLCIVEAMKMMNEVKSTVEGTVVAINTKNGEIVKKGDVLFIIK